MQSERIRIVEILEVEKGTDLKWVEKRKIESLACEWIKLDEQLRSLIKSMNNVEDRTLWNTIINMERRAI